MDKGITCVTSLFLVNNTARGPDVHIILISSITVVPNKIIPFERLFLEILSSKNQNNNLHYQVSKKCSEEINMSLH